MSLLGSSGHRTDLLLRILNAIDTALDAIGEGVVVADPRQPDLPLVFVNDAFCRITGYAREDVIGRNCRFLQGPETEPDAVDAIRDAIAHGQKCVVDLTNYREDGTPFRNRLSIVPVFNEGPLPEYFVGVQADITLLHEVQARLAARD